MNMFDMTEIVEEAELKDLVVNTYVFAVIALVIAFAVALLIAKLIKWQGNPDRSYVKRRIWCIVIGVVIPLLFFLRNATYCSSYIGDDEFSHSFTMHNCIASFVVIFLGYAILSIITMLIFRKSKWGSILGKK